MFSQKQNATTDSNSTKTRLIDNNNNSELYFHDYSNAALQKR